MADLKPICSLLAVCLALGGCELVADFDRDKIPQPDAGAPATTDAGTPDGATPDAMLPDVDAAATDVDGGPADLDAGATADAGP